MTAIRIEATEEQMTALREIVEEWIDEGFTTPPYSDAQYDVFEALGIFELTDTGYDTRRPTQPT